MIKEAVATTSAPGAVGPYSQGIRSGQVVVTSGQLPAPPDGELVTHDIGDATIACLKNVRAILEAGGAALADVIKVTVFLTDMGDFAAVNRAYESFFQQPYPARSCIEVARLPMDAPIEIEAMAVVSG